MQSENSSDRAPSTATGSKRLRRVLVLVASLLVVHPLIARGFYAILNFNQPLQRCRYVMVATPSAECYDEAARLLEDRLADELLIPGMRPGRAVRAGAFPSIDQRAAVELSARGITADEYRFVPTDAVTGHQLYRQFDQQLAGDGDGCVVISLAFAARYQRVLITQSLPPANAQRYRIRSVPKKENEPWTWYFDRSQVRRVMGSGLRLLFLVFHGESTIHDNDLDRLLLRQGQEQ